MSDCESYKGTGDDSIADQVRELYERVSIMCMDDHLLTKIKEDMTTPQLVSALAGLRETVDDWEDAGEIKDEIARITNLIIDTSDGALRRVLMEAKESAKGLNDYEELLEEIKQAEYHLMDLRLQKKFMEQSLCPDPCLKDHYILKGPFVRKEDDMD
jgi:hypothetical protein